MQAYLLLALWGCGPVERFEQDKTWLLLGLAIRMGTDLNLHRKGVGLPSDGPRAEWRARERELRNRERTWMCVVTSFIFYFSLVVNCRLTESCLLLPQFVLRPRQKLERADGQAALDYRRVSDFAYPPERTFLEPFCLMSLAILYGTQIHSTSFRKHIHLTPVSLLTR